MAALTIPLHLPNVRRLTLTVVNQWYEVTVPSEARKVSLRPITNDAFVGWETGAGPTQLADEDAYASGDDHWATIDADGWTEMHWRPERYGGHPRTNLFLASATGGTVVEIMIEGQ